MTITEVYPTKVGLIAIAQTHEGVEQVIYLSQDQAHQVARRLLSLNLREIPGSAGNDREGEDE